MARTAATALAVRRGKNGVGERGQSDQKTIGNANVAEINFGLSMRFLWPAENFMAEIGVPGWIRSRISRSLAAYSRPTPSLVICVTDQASVVGPDYRK